jgi:ubiquinone biosynthesis protein UbiJ
MAIATGASSLTHEMLRAELHAQLEPIGQEMTAWRPLMAGSPIFGIAIENLRQDVRMLRAAINDMARVNITAGEVEALHTEIDRMQTKQMELETRLAALEQVR